MIWNIPIADFLLLLCLGLASSLLSRREANVIPQRQKQRGWNPVTKGEGRCSLFWDLTKLLLSWGCLSLMMGWKVGSSINQLNLCESNMFDVILFLWDDLLQWSPWSRVLFHGFGYARLIAVQKQMVIPLAHHPEVHSSLPLCPSTYIIPSPHSFTRRLL